jgi:hypothetical protein
MVITEIMMDSSNREWDYKVASDEVNNVRNTGKYRITKYE